MTALQQSALIWLVAILLLLFGLRGYFTSTSTASVEMLETGEELVQTMDLTSEVVQALYTDDEMVVIDVREQWEYDQGHIPGAQLIPIDELPNRLNEVPRGERIVVVCERGIRSDHGKHLLIEEGFENVHNMVDGMEAWRQRGYDQVTGM